MKALKMMVVLLAMLVLATSAFALPLKDFKVKLNDNQLEEVGSNYIESVDRDNTFDVEVRFSVDDNASAAKYENVQVEAVLRGYDHSDLIGDITSAFDIKRGRTYTKYLTLNLPVRLEQGEYRLRVRVEDAAGETFQKDYMLDVEADSHAVWIKDINLNPATIEAGRAFLATVRVENVGNKDEKDGVKVSMSVPELDLGPVSDYIDSLDEGEATSSEELFLRVPACTPAGEYKVKVVATYHDGDEQTTAYTTLKVVEGESCAATSTTTGPEVEVTAPTFSQRIQIGGKGAIYPVTVSNNGKEAKSFTIKPTLGSWGSAVVSPSNTFVVEPGRTKTAYVYVTADEDATDGDELFEVSVMEGDNVVDDVTLKAELYHKANTEEVVVVKQPTENTGSSLKYTLEIVLLVVLVLLVLLGLIIGFKKLSSKDSSEEEDENYY